MRPTSEIDPRALASLRGVVFDIDDTVTRGGVLERVAYEAMWRLHEAGLRTIAVTGRPLGWVDVIARQWPVDLGVGENGAGWVRREGHDVVEGYYHEEPQERAAHAAALDRIAARVAQEVPEARLAGDHRARRCDIAWDIGERARADEETVAAIGAIIAAEGARVSRSSVHIHAVVGEWDKARGVVRAARSIGVDLERERARWLFVGDSGNDEAAFAYFPLSVGVANVRSHAAITRWPAYVTDADRGEGFAEIAGQALDARIDGKHTSE